MTRRARLRRLVRRCLGLTRADDLGSLAASLGPTYRDLRGGAAR